MPIYKDKERGTWYVVVRVDGKQVKRRGFRTKAEAQHEEALLLIDKPKQTITVETLTKDFLKYKEKRIKQSAHSTYQTYADKFVYPYFKNQPVQKIHYKEAEQFLDYLRDSGYSPNYCNHVFGFIKSVFNYGMRYHGLETNPFVLVERPRQTKQAEMNTWSPNEFSRFYKALTNDRAKIMFLTMYWTGIRRGEMRGLQWTDLDWNAAVLHITKQYSRYGGITDPKSESGRRDIDIPNSLLSALKEWHDYMSGHEGFKDSWYMFGDLEPIGLNTIAWHWNKGIKESGVTPIRLHDLRHSHASWLFAHKFDTAYISRRLGHSSIAITLQIYTHLMDDVRQREVKRLNDMVLVNSTI